MIYTDNGIKMLYFKLYNLFKSFEKEKKKNITKITFLNLDLQ